jgi:hypothetical protein
MMNGCQEGIWKQLTYDMMIPYTVVGLDQYRANSQAKTRHKVTKIITNNSLTCPTGGIGIRNLGESARLAVENLKLTLSGLSDCAGKKGFNIKRN